jgi:cytochrome c peroxidase
MTERERRFFKAIFADRAVSMACVACHNSHELSTKRDYQLYDVMGGIIISFPVP